MQISTTDLPFVYLCFIDNFTSTVLKLPTIYLLLCISNALLSTVLIASYLPEFLSKNDCLTIKWKVEALVAQANEQEYSSLVKMKAASTFLPSLWRCA